MNNIPTLLFGIGVGLVLAAIWDAWRRRRAAAASQAAGSSKPAPNVTPNVRNIDVWKQCLGMRLSSAVDLPIASPINYELDELVFESVPKGDEPTFQKTVSVKATPGYVTLVT